MGKWRINGCPRCGGSVFVDNDRDGWYEQCIYCSFRNDLNVSLEFGLTLANKDEPSSEYEIAIIAG